jgi:ABC-type spermidine/putrescine transport system permease subunit II
VLPAFGYFPAIGGTEFSLQPWRDLLAYPGFATALRLTLTVGITATLLSLALAVGICAVAQGRLALRRFAQLATPLLAAPHSAVALGFAFLVAPSGWLVRLVSPWLTGWQRPPDLVTIQDPLGLVFIAGLLLKEVPYLVLMIAGAVTQVPADAQLAAARAMGYHRPVAWVKIVLPQIYPQIRLPVYAVIAFSLSVVEVGLILAPGNPPPLAVLAARWFADYDLKLYFPAAAAAMDRTLAKEQQVEFEKGAAEDLAEFVAADLMRLKTEIEKLATYAGERKLICRQDISTLVISEKTTTVWELADMLASRKQKKALEFLDRLLRDGEEPLPMLGAIAWMYRKLIEASEVKGVTNGWQAARALGMRPEQAEVALQSARRIPKPRLLNGLCALQKADDRLKRGGEDARAILEFLVTDLTSA